jgi:hypothetical protein
VYRVKTDDENIYINITRADSVGSAEIVFSGKAQPGVTASDVNVQEVALFPSMGHYSYTYNDFYTFFSFFHIIHAFSGTSDVKLLMIWGFY